MIRFINMALETGLVSGIVRLQQILPFYEGKEKTDFKNFMFICLLNSIGNL